ncbi:hypothetical protein BDW59DRAFT_177105 [Aspergillus cavernicola]|uniref:Uncharacterized protein n=1 Tax=Aspergillus cavernicola TaxID=176166 RepID=A0ABR4H6J2_9EURO
MAMIAAAAPSLVRIEKFSLFNGEKSVIIETGPPAANSTDIKQSLAEGDLDCHGSAFCERLGGSCDDAYCKVIPSNIYTTFLDGTCGLFVSSEHCEAMGQDLLDAYDELRDEGHCSHCGRKEIANNCMIKIDQVTGY